MQKPKAMLHMILGMVVLATFFVVACGSDPEPAPAPAAKPAAKAKATATPTSPPAAAAEKPAAKPTKAAPKATPKKAAPKAAAPEPTPTAAPTATPKPKAAPKPAAVVVKEPVVSRLKVAIPPPQYQSLAMFDSVEGILPAMEHVVGVNRESGAEDTSRLAEEWGMDATGTVWTFKFREGIPFHTAPDFSGAELGAVDMIKTLQVLGSDLSNRPSIWTNFGVESSNFATEGLYTLKWTLNSPAASIPSWLSPQAPSGVISADYFNLKGENGYLTHPVGTGPWKFREVSFGQYLRYDRVEDHWRKTPEFKELEYLFAPEDATRLAMLLAQEVHISDVPRALLPEAAARGFKVVSGSLPGMTVFVFIGGQYYDGERTYLRGPKKGEIEPIAPGYDASDPFRDVRVREALNISIDKEAVIEAFWSGAAIPQAQFSLTPVHKDHKDSWTPYPYDQAKARKLLAEAGYADGFEFTFETAKVGGVPEVPEVAEVLAQMWSEVGIKANLTELGSFSQIRSKYRARDIGRYAYPVRYSINRFQTNTCYPMSNVSGGCGSPQWEYDALDEIFINLQNAVTDADIQQYTHEMGDFLYDNYVIVPIAFLYPQAAFDPSVISETEPGFDRFMVDQGPTEGLEYVVPVYK